MILSMGAIATDKVIHNVWPEAAVRGRVQEGDVARSFGIIEYWMPISDYKKPNNNFS